MFCCLFLVFFYIIIQVITQYEGLDEYLKVVDAYVDIFLQNHMVRYNRFSYCYREKMFYMVVSYETILVGLLIYCFCFVFC